MITADAANIKGDVNGDNKITLRDATLVQKIQVGLYTPNEAQQYAADFDGNNSVELADAFTIQRFVCLDSSTLEKFAPNRIERINFFEALNKDRAAANLPPIEYNDAMLEAGNIRAKEYMATGTHTRPNGSSYYTVIDECNLTYNPAVPPLEFAGIDGGSGTTLYNNLKAKDAEKPDQVYRLLMSGATTLFLLENYRFKRLITERFCGKIYPYKLL